MNLVVFNFASTFLFFLEDFIDVSILTQQEHVVFLLAFRIEIALDRINPLSFPFLIL